MTSSSSPLSSLLPREEEGSKSSPLSSLLPCEEEGSKSSPLSSLLPCEEEGSKLVSSTKKKSFASCQNAPTFRPPYKFNLKSSLLTLFSCSSRSSLTKILYPWTRYRVLRTLNGTQVTSNPTWLPGGWPSYSLQGV